EVAQDWETTKVLAYPAAPSPTKTPAPKKPPAEELPPQELPPPAYDCSQYKDPYTCEAATACVWAMESGGCIDQ
ncbi:MAG: hypothetical protein ACK2T0_15230, partial [Anaerolineales bacterium]